jgi:hypothetical protein
MKILNVIEALLNCFYLVMELCGVAERHCRFLRRSR